MKAATCLFNSHWLVRQCCTILFCFGLEFSFGLGIGEYICSLDKFCVLILFETRVLGFPSLRAFLLIVLRFCFFSFCHFAAIMFAFEIFIKIGLKGHLCFFHGSMFEFCVRTSLSFLFIYLSLVPCLWVV